MMDMESLEAYVKTFFKLCEAEEPELYHKIRQMHESGNGKQVRDIMWEVILKEHNSHTAPVVDT